MIHAVVKSTVIRMSLMSWDGGLKKWNRKVIQGIAVAVSAYRNDTSRKWPGI